MAIASALESDQTQRMVDRAALRALIPILRERRIDPSWHLASEDEPDLAPLTAFVISGRQIDLLLDTADELLRGDAEAQS